MNKRCRYVCKIEDRDGRPEFILTVIERGKEQVVHRDFSCRGTISISLISFYSFIHYALGFKSDTTYVNHT